MRPERESDFLRKYGKEMKGQIMATKQKAEIQGQTVVCLKTKTSAFDGKELAVAMERLNAKCGHEHEWIAPPELPQAVTSDPVPALRAEIDRLRSKIKGQLQDLEAKDRKISSMQTEIEKLIAAAIEAEKARK